jgi:hypothetical protein
VLRLQSPQTWVSLDDGSPYGIAPRGAFQGPFGWSSDAGLREPLRAAAVAELLSAQSRQ